MLVLIDNQDSFTYNIVHSFQSLGQTVEVIPYSSASLNIISKLPIKYLVIGPGPGSPVDLPLCKAIIKSLSKVCPILGICLGHQCIAETFGASIIRASYPIHGKSSLISHNSTGLFKGLPNPLKVGRYHSLVVDPLNLPDELIVTAQTKTNEIMGLQHQTFPIHSVQFHPESVLSEAEVELFNNFLMLTH